MLLVLILALAWTQGGNETSLSPIAQAAIRTQHSPGARFSFHGTSQRNALSHPIAMSGKGMFNGQTNRSQTAMTIRGPDGEAEMEGVGSGSQAYYKSKLLQPALPPGDEWLGLDLSLGISSETAVAANSDPSVQLDLLRAVSDKFETLGREKIRGLEATVYRSTFDSKGYADYLRGKGSVNEAQQYERLAEVAPSTTEVEVWVDSKKLVRRMRMQTESHDPHSGEEISTEVAADFYEFGISPDIDLPDSDTVYDATPKIRAKLGLDDAH